MTNVVVINLIHATEPLESITTEGGPGRVTGHRSQVRIWLIIPALLMG